MMQQGKGERGGQERGGGGSACERVRGMRIVRELSFVFAAKTDKTTIERILFNVTVS